MSRRLCDQCERRDDDQDEVIGHTSADLGDGSTAIVGPTLDTSPVGDGTPAKLCQLQLDDSSIKFVLEAKESDKQPSDVIKAKGTEVQNLVQIWD